MIAASQLFYKNNGDSRIILFVANVVDNFIMTRTHGMVGHFHQSLDRDFTLG